MIPAIITIACAVAFVAWDCLMLRYAADADEAMFVGGRVIWAIVAAIWAARYAGLLP